MLLTAIGDIHGNLPALEAVLRAVDERGIQTIVNTGDAIAGFPWPNEVVDLLRARAIPSVQGRTDWLVARFSRSEAKIRRQWPAEYAEHLHWTHSATRSENIEFLLRLPKQRTLTVDGIPVFFCHGSPGGRFATLHADDPDETFRRQREIAMAPIIVTGDTHQPFARWVDETLFVNPGSVGMPGCNAVEAHYAIINTEDDPWQTEFHRVPYDTARLEARLRECRPAFPAGDFA